MKKNLFRTAALCLAVLFLTCAFCACAKTLSGTYTADGLLSQSFTFDRDNKVTMSAFGLDVSGTYRIEGDRIVITYSVLGFSHDWEQPFKKSGNSIFINGQEFVKQ